MQNVAIQRQETHKQMLHEFTCINQKDLMDKEKQYLEQTQDDHSNNRILSDPYRIPIEIRPDSTKIL